MTYPYRMIMNKKRYNRKLRRQKPKVSIPVIETSNNQSVGSITDLTIHGLGVTGPKYLISGNTYKFKIDTPKDLTENLNISLEARCIWCNVTNQNQECHSGFIIERISSSDLDRLMQLLKSECFEQFEKPDHESGVNQKSDIKSQFSE